nr:sugar phosphate nucleotidyltransferase [uncultured Dysosmobacter sp.]
MEKPVLVVMAAGMGSRYGGLKQIDPVGGHGQLIIDYSIYDARRAGFETVVFVIKHEIEETFKAAIGDRLSKVIHVKYAYQDLDDLPAGYEVPADRVKPWGTAHAILAARKVIDGPFAVINADDCYGPEGFRAIYDYLESHPDQPGCYEYAMVGYLLGNTVTEHGHVARGVCEEDGEQFLVRVTERTCIEKDGADARFTEDDGKTWTPLAGDTMVSMNLWGFTASFLREAEARFPAFLDKALAENPLKGEYFLPSVVTQLLDEGKARVKVLRSHDKWYGVTYQEDKPAVVAAIAEKTAQGLYPDKLWET